MTGPTPPQPPYGGPPPGGPQPPPYGQPPYGQQPPPYGQPPQTPPGGSPFQQPGTPPGGAQFQQPGPPPPPPYGQQPVQPGDYPPPPMAPQGIPVKRSKKKLWITLIVIVVLVGGGIAWAAIAGKKSPANAEAGDCIKVNSASSTNADVEKIDCNDKIAVFKVAKRLGDDTDNCPNENYEKYTQSGRGSDFALCLMLNAKEGECFADFDSPDKRARADCAAAQIKVVKVVQKADEKECTDGFALVYPDPATTFCLIPATGT